MIVYAVPGGVERVLLGDAVLEQFRHFRQVHAERPEAGGQLFARIEKPDVLVTHASGPKTRDRRSRVSFCPNRRIEQQEITAMYRDGLHYVGDWHTHPERRPNASATDLRSIGEIVRRSRHGFGGFLLVVVGTLEPPDGLSVYLHDGSRPHGLRPVGSVAALGSKNAVTSGG